MLEEVWDKAVEKCINPCGFHGRSIFILQDVLILYFSVIYGHKTKSIVAPGFDHRLLKEKKEMKFLK